MMRRRLVVSIDVERDIPRFFQDSYRGVDEALFPLIEELRRVGYSADLLVERSVMIRKARELKSALSQGHLLGCHGEHTDPVFATAVRTASLVQRVAESKATFEQYFGHAPWCYRQANFAVNQGVLSAIAKGGFLVDSSVLPNRIVRRHGLRKLVDHQGCPIFPYRPSATDHRKEGGGPILEIPVTENPLARGDPIGAGFFNRYGLEATLTALNQSAGDPVVFLIHPWECIDMSGSSERLPEWVLRISKPCSKDLVALLERCSNKFEPASFADVSVELGIDFR